MPHSQTPTDAGQSLSATDASPGAYTAVPWRAYLEEIRAECLRYWRLPGFIVPTMLFSPLIFALIVMSNGPTITDDAVRQILARMGTFGTMAPGLFSFGVAIAIERENGYLKMKQIMPVPMIAYPLAKMAMAMLTTMVLAAVLLIVVATLTAARLSFATQIVFIAVMGVGTLPFCAIGLFIGSLVSGNAAPGIINLIYIPMAFLSGLFIPLQRMPDLVQKGAWLWPSFYLRGLSGAAMGLSPIPPTDILLSIIVLVAYTLVFILAAGHRLASRGLPILPRRGIHRNIAPPR